SDSGYLVIAGGMGRGKTSWMAEHIWQEIDLGNVPVYHFIDLPGLETDGVRRVANCLYARLLRKHVMLEPKEWADSQLSVEEKLHRLLGEISRSRLPDEMPEVLYIDAADQSEADSSRPLIPGALRQLPPGVFCVITTRHRMDWLSACRNMTIWEM